MSQLNFNPIYGTHNVYPPSSSSSFASVRPPRPELNHRQLKVANRQSLELNFKNKAFLPDRQQQLVTPTLTIGQPEQQVTLLNTNVDQIKEYNPDNTPRCYTLNLQGAEYDFSQVILKDVIYEDTEGVNLDSVGFEMELQHLTYATQTAIDKNIPETNQVYQSLTPPAISQENPKREITVDIGTPGTSPRSYHSLPPSPLSTHSASREQGAGSDNSFSALQNLTPPKPTTPTPASTIIPTHGKFGKGIKMVRNPPRPGKTMENLNKIDKTPLDQNKEQDDPKSEDEIGEESNFEVTWKTVETLMNEMEIDEDSFLKEIESFSKLNDSEDAYALTQNRVELFVNISKLLDNKCKKSSLKVDFANLFVGGSPDLRTLWNRMNLKVPTLFHVPTWLRWILIYVCLCFGTNVNRKIVTEELNKTVKKFSDTKYETRNTLSYLKSLVKNLTKSKCDTTNRGDFIDVDRTFRDKPTPRATSSPVNNRAATSYFSEPTKRQLSTPTPPRPSPPRSLKDKNSMYNSDGESSHSDSSSTKRMKNRKFNMDRLAHDYPVRKRWSPFSDCHLTNVFDRTLPDASIRGEKRVSFNEERSAFSAPDRAYASGQDRERVFDTAEEHLIKKLSIIPQYNDQRLMACLRPNKFVAEATRDVLVDLISKAKENPEMSVRFGDVIKSFVKKVTLSVMGRATFELNDMINTLSSQNCIKKKDAISICISLYSSIHSGEGIFTISWNSLTNWASGFSKLLNDEIVRIALKQTTGDQEDDIKKEFPEFRRRMEEKLRGKHKEILSLFEKLSAVNDMCLYILFGLNVMKTENQTVYTDLIVKSILLTWRTKGRFPNEERGQGLNNIFWCLPLAHLMKLQGFGAVNVVEENAQTICSFDDFMEEGLEIADTNG